MKKIFTLIFATAMLSTAFAQYGQRDDRDRGRNDDVYASNKGYGKSYGTYVFTAREKNMQIEQIYRDYNYKIQSVKNKPFMGWFQKKRVISNLEAQRDAEICQVNDKFNSPKNLFNSYGRRDGHDRRDDRDDRKRW